MFIVDSACKTSTPFQTVLAQESWAFRSVESWYVASAGDLACAKAHSSSKSMIGFLVAGVVVNHDLPMLNYDLPMLNYDLPMLNYDLPCLIMIYHMLISAETSRSRKIIIHHLVNYDLLGAQLCRNQPFSP